MAMAFAARSVFASLIKSLTLSTILLILLFVCCIGIKASAVVCWTLFICFKANIIPATNAAKITVTAPTTPTAGHNLSGLIVAITNNDTEILTIASENALTKLTMN